jgi:hypothetical protein
MIFWCPKCLHVVPDILVQWLIINIFFSVPESQLEIFTIEFLPCPRELMERQCSYDSAKIKTRLTYLLVSI